MKNWYAVLQRPEMGFSVMIGIISPVLLFFIPCDLMAQILPKENSQLNYRIIGFSFPQEKKSGICTLEIAQGHFNNQDSFKKSIIKSIACETNKVIAEVPAFGSDYTWRILSVDKGNKTNDSLHHFSTGINKKVDTGTFRLRIIQEAKQYKDAYVFVDESHAMYDMKGNAVWFLPDIENITANSVIRDLKISPQGTITFTEVDGGIFEINYDGTIIWKGPNTGEVSGDTTEHYHHEFTRLNNGHYMVLGNETVFWPLPDYHEDSSVKTGQFGITLDSNNIYHQKMILGTIIEYDEKGNLVWFWKSADYFKNSDLAERKRKEGRYSIDETHENSFYFDERNKNIYISYRNISRILKVKYPEGMVLKSYGTKYAPGIEELGTDLFCGQHSVKLSSEGYLYVFDNNSLKRGNLPKIVMMAEPTFETDTLRKIWEYRCTVEGMSDSEKSAYDRQTEHMSIRTQRTERMNLKLAFTNGGNVVELEDRSMFVSSCMPFSKIFIVDKSKKTLWSSILETWVPDTKIWIQQSIYRASIIPYRKDLERLIWNAEEPLPASRKGR